LLLLLFFSLVKSMKVGPILTAKYITSSLLKVALRDVMSSIWFQQSIVLIGIVYKYQFFFLFIYYFIYLY